MIYVVGAFCLDVIVEADEFLHNTSTPGRISVRPGGVGYNIFSHLSGERRLITAIGNDEFSGFVHSFIGSDDVVLHTMDAPPPMYVAFMERGELNLGASQMDAVEHALDADTIMESLADAGRGDIVVLDANLHPDVLKKLVLLLKNRCRVFFEPISSAKASRHKEWLSDIFIMTPDRREFEVLLDAADPDDDYIFSYLDSRSIEFLLATRGREGARLYGHEKRWDFAPGCPLDITDSTGAGDMLTAVLAESVAAGISPEKALPDCMAKVEKMLAGRSRS